MQSYQDRVLVQALQGEVGELVKAMPANATHHVIGLMPTQGSEITINGIVWVVERIHSVRGWMRLRLKRP